MPNVVVAWTIGKIILPVGKDIEQMRFNMSEKFTAKGFVVSDLNTILANREKVFQRLWEGRLGGQIPVIPPLNTVMHETSRFLQRHF